MIDRLSVIQSKAPHGKSHRKLLLDMTYTDIDDFVIL